MRQISLVVFCVAVSTIAGSARAECVGLSVPPPEELNICRTLIEDLVIPPVIRFEPTCNIEGAECLILPHCCVPGACLGFPECVITEEIIERAEQVIHAGDTYCSVEEVTGHSLLVDFVNKRIADPTELLSGGVNSVVFRSVGAELDEIECRDASGLGNFKEIVRGFMAEMGYPGDITDADIDYASIVSKRDSGLPVPLDDYDAITLGSLIVLQDAEYDVFNNAAWNWTGTIKTWGDREMYVLLLVMHELVHVRQYREAGREKFLNNYLVELLLHGYAEAGFEAEAYKFSDQRGASGSMSWVYQAAVSIFSR